jgi:hypothetical protein
VIFGYARVSTAEQNPDHQIDALRRAGVANDDIYVDHASGAKASRPLDNLLRLLREGDTLKITRLATISSRCSSASTESIPNIARPSAQRRSRPSLSLLVVVAEGAVGQLPAVDDAVSGWQRT